MVAKPVILSCFDYSTEAVKPWAEAGFTCICVDKQHPPGITRRGKIVLVGADMRTWKPPKGLEIGFASFFPPCTDDAVSGSSHFRDKGLGALIRSLQLVKACIDIQADYRIPYYIEHPVSTISTYWRKPDYTFHPSDYGSGYTKKTCLWTGGGFVMPPKRPSNFADKNRILGIGPCAERKNIRSRTDRGFARAVFKANYKGVMSHHAKAA